MEQITLSIEPRLVKMVDDVVKKERIYSSRAEFIREAVRVRLSELSREVLIKRGRREAKGRVVRGEISSSPFLTKEEKAEVIREHLKKHGLSSEKFLDRHVE